MKLCVLTVALGHMPLEEALPYLAKRGVKAVEIGAGGYPGKKHLDPAKLLGDRAATDRILKTATDNGIEISAIACHGNNVHPNKARAAEFCTDFENAILLAEQMGVDTIITFSGCPGDCETSQYPNWVTCPWPEDFTEVLDYQWNKVLIPYWKKAAVFAKAHGIRKIAFEMHPGFCVYNPETLLRLRAAVGDVIGANFDPSHLIWQGMDPVAAIRTLGDAIYHFHAKDTKIDEENKNKNGVLDTKHYADILGRSWSFRTIGYGTDRKVWKDMISMLRTVGYDGAISIEHEDALMSPEEGLNKAIQFLQDILIEEPVGDMYWA